MSCSGLLGLGSPRLGSAPAWRGSAWPGPACLARLGPAWLGSARCDAAPAPALSGAGPGASWSRRSLGGSDLTRYGPGGQLAPTSHQPPTHGPPQRWRLFEDSSARNASFGASLRTGFFRVWGATTHWFFSDGPSCRPGQRIWGSGLAWARLSLAWLGSVRLGSGSAQVGPAQPGPARLMLGPTRLGPARPDSAPLGWARDSCWPTGEKNR